MAKQHSQVGASSMDRWSACPGSVRLCKDIPRRTSVNAAEGTVAHALAEECITNGVDPETCLGETREADGHKFVVDQEMVDGVALYMEVLQNDFKEEDGSIMAIEQQFDLSKIYPGAFGTSDAIIYQQKSKRLRVYDFKYGAGVAVEVVDNSQMKFYGLGTLLETGYRADDVELVVVQPRCPHDAGRVRRWLLPAIDLLDFAADLVKFAKATEDPNAPLVPGSHCRWCPAAAVCPAVKSKAQELAKAEFGAHLSYDPNKLAEVPAQLPLIEGWVKSVREFAYAEAEAGRMPPGFKLVAKRAMRRWRDEKAAIANLSVLLDDEQIFEKKLNSPAKIEKLLTKEQRSALDELVVSESSGHTLAPLDDPRPPVKLDAKVEFAGILD
jgi:hypothetical protein